MCLAVPGRVVETDGDVATVDFQGNRLSVNTILTPEVAAGQWVLVHAGFAITTVRKEDALLTWEYLREIDDAAWREETHADDAMSAGRRDGDG